MKQIQVDELLPGVQKPSRYLGNELNAVHKDPAGVDVRIALAFPDLYDLGLSNLGLSILYGILNAMPGVWAERVYAPAPDMEQALRGRGLPLFSLESWSALADFDAVGFTLQYELCGTNVVNMLDLAGIPIYSAERGDADPLVLGGGPVAFSPEPLADFFDAIVVGDGEEVVRSLALALRAGKGRPRAGRLDLLEGIPGVYLPQRFPALTLPDGTVIRDPARPRVRKALVADLDRTPFPAAGIVPFLQQVHDRVSLEVLRGCTQGCRFCQAGMLYRPVRERSLDTIQGQILAAIEKTGYEEISLSSLSTCDYSRVRSLVEMAVRTAGPRGVAISLPSLRMGSFSVELAEMISGVRKTGLTFAPEAASDRLRAVIDKWIPDEELFETTGRVFASGWESVKLYFMIGLPTETLADVERIATLATEVLRRGRAVNRRARVHVSVSTFVPKPHTPFQREAQLRPEEVRERHELLKKKLFPVRAIKVSLHDVATSWLEGIFSRGDRRLSGVIVEAWRRGARFDAWTEHFRPAAWEEALAAGGLDGASFTRRREPGEPLPWDHIDSGVSREYLEEEHRKALAAELTSDCRAVCHRCGLIDTHQAACLRQIHAARAGRKAEAGWTLPAIRDMVPAGAPAVSRIRFRFGKTGRVRFLSHLELQSALTRALRRAALPLAESHGFHPKPLISFATALPVGLESVGEYAEIDLTETVDPVDFLARLGQALPEGLPLFSAREVPLPGRSMARQFVATGWEVDLAPLGAGGPPSGDAGDPGGAPPSGIAPPVEGAAPALRERVRTFLESPEVLVERWSKQGPKPGDVRGPVLDMELHPAEDGRLLLRFVLREGNASARPRDVLRGLLGIDEPAVTRLGLRKLDSFVRPGEELVSAALAG